MSDPTRPPGFEFRSVRLMKAQYELLDDPGEQAQGEITMGYSDKVDVRGLRVTVRQNMHVRIVDPSDNDKVFVQVVVELEGDFEANQDANLDPQDFGNNHAPAILFAFTREWVHKLTSAAGSWPPILLPPTNVLELRKRLAAAEK